MDKYPLQALLQVRTFRENEAQQKLVRAKKAKQDADKMLLDAKQALQDYITWRLAEEKKRYDAIMGIVCSKQDLDNLRNELEQLKIKDISLQQDIDAAQNEVLRCAEALQLANETFFQRRKEKEKLLAHKDSWTEDAIKEELHVEEYELEDFQAQGADKVGTVDKSVVGRALLVR